MDYSKQHLIELGLKTNFIKDNLEKVLRLDDILNKKILLFSKKC